MSDFLTAAWHLRYVLAAITFLAWLAIRLASRANDRYIERHVAAALDEPTDMTWTDEALGRVLAALDETDETWAWANDAIQLANDDTFDRTLAEIRALPTSKES